MRFSNLVVLFAASALPLGAFAAPAGRAPVRSARVALLPDDDGGHVETIVNERGGDLESHGGRIVVRPHLVALFVGESWSSDANAALRASVVAHLRAFGASPEYAGLTRYGVAATGLPVTTASLPAPAGDLSDLDLHRVLAAGLRSGTLNERDEDAVYVLLLAPEVLSHLRDSRPGTDYAAYHSDVHIDDVHLRYLVVPASSATGMRETLTSGIVRTVLNPDGDGWY